MWSVLEYFSEGGGEVEGGKEGETKEAEDHNKHNNKGSDPSYTICYPPQEDLFLKKVEQEEQEKEKEMAADEPKKRMSKKQRKKQMQRNILWEERKKKVEEWFEGLDVRIKSKIKVKFYDQSWEFDAGLGKLLCESNFKFCPNLFCHFPFERVVDENVKLDTIVLDEFGKPLSNELKTHYLINRFRCRRCHVEFCAGCNAIPYHLGETCEQFSRKKNGCRFCKNEVPTPATTEPPPDTKDAKAITKIPVCSRDECKNYERRACTNELPCEHLCSGVKHDVCFCLHPKCAPPNGLTYSDFCSICWTDDLGVAPCVKAKCGHVFHEHCLEYKLDHKWPGARITFSFANCTVCNTPLEVTDINISRTLANLKQMENGIKLRALHFLNMEGMEKDEAVTSPKGRFYQNLEGYAMHTFSFYQCHRCEQPYYGGKPNCEQEIMNYNPEELICGGCSGATKCEKHGKGYMHFKCRFCCSLASWFCFGLVHYCEQCHSEPYLYWSPSNCLSSLPPQCPGKDKCPLGIDHPPNGFEEFLLGCSMCKLEEATGETMIISELEKQEENWLDW